MNAAINTDWLREVCMAFPGTTEQIQWGYDLVFKVGGKMFAITPLEPAPVFLSFKTSPENFAELTERPSIIPAPYLARAKWVALESRDAISAGELASLLRESYELVTAKLPRRVRAGLASPAKSKTTLEAKPVSARVKRPSKKIKQQGKRKPTRRGK